MRGKKTNHKRQIHNSRAIETVCQPNQWRPSEHYHPFQSLTLIFQYVRYWRMQICFGFNLGSKNEYETLILSHLTSTFLNIAENWICTTNVTVERIFLWRRMWFRNFGNVFFRVWQMVSFNTIPTTTRTATNQIPRSIVKVSDMTQWKCARKNIDGTK